MTLIMNLFIIILHTRNKNGIAVIDNICKLLRKHNILQFPTLREKYLDLKSILYLCSLHNKDRVLLACLFILRCRI